MHWNYIALVFKTSAYTQCNHTETLCTRTLRRIHTAIYCSESTYFLSSLPFFFSTQLEKKGDKGHEITLNNAVILETEQKNSDYKCSYVRIFRRCALTLLLSLVTLNSCITGVHCPLARSFSHFLPGVLSELYTHFICLYYTGDIWDMFFPFIPVQSHWNRRDQPEHQ